MNRNCEVCGSNCKERIHSQKFLMPGRRNFFSYDVVACKCCGFIFADNIPNQQAYDKYYKENKKYSYSRNIPAGLMDIYNGIYTDAKRFLTKMCTSSIGREKFSILDIGCSIGALLNVFKQHGFQCLTGIEPSQYCSRLAKELYEIDVFPGLLSEYSSDNQFDFIMMTGVLEHVSDFEKVIPYVVEHLKNSGALMIAVPDASKFSLKPAAPYDEFSIEHINYFTNISLTNLMQKFGLVNINHTSNKTTFYDSYLLISYFKKSHLSIQREKDSVGMSRIKKYIKASGDKIDRLNAEWERLITADTKIVVWGVGSLTYRLLASSSLAQMKISAFVDSNTFLQGKKIRNVQIVSPDYFEHNTAELVIVASHVYGKEIEHILKNKYHFAGNILHI